MFISEDPSATFKYGQGLDSKGTLDNPQNIHNDRLVKTKSFPCTQCDNSYDYERTLQSHLESHYNVTNFKYFRVIRILREIATLPVMLTQSKLGCRLSATFVLMNLPTKQTYIDTNDL